MTLQLMHDIHVLIRCQLKNVLELISVELPLARSGLHGVQVHVQHLSAVDEREQHMAHDECAAKHVYCTKPRSSIER